MKFKSIILSSILFTLPTQLLAQDPDCGEPPAEPAIVDGATTSRDQLLANSKEVNAYIAEADEFLDCSEVRYKKLSASKVHREKLAELVKEVTARRNEIGDEFNAQVAAFQAANPE